MRKVHEDFGKLWELNAVWNYLTPDEKEFIDKHTEIKRYRKNEVIHSEGDQTTHVVMVVQGTVRLTKEGVGQRLQIIRLLKPYDTFGMTLYPIPRADSVPTDLWEVVDDPIFYAEELSPNLLWARAYKTGDSGDSTGWHMKFSVLYGDMVIHIRTKAVDPDWVYKQLYSFIS